ncbi:FAD binding domain-containing protein [Lindgomyces ingoldianus]|uniref:FAD binding domain-containing protein n=1 Tax=Lindgomyces ingoldianus TaxID=673940 RepID=A0ACB6QER1_9PLEO|nr:FAD binding domain-containing protein [Lindgomyces ingoldianus]KAF2464847.1 FAD binding domain-containing protein [Lindgomyces ingoldianus]
MGRRPPGFPSAFWLATFLAASSNATPILFGPELIQLVDSNLKALPSNVASLFSPESSQPPNAITSRCKIYPGDPAWPSDETWAQLNELTDNRLLVKPQPQATVCYNGPQYDPSKCAQLTAKWSSSYIHFPDPIEMMSPVAQGMTCLPPNIFDSHNCTRGGFPMYVINATTPKHIQLGVNFARNTGVRLVVKNTGHDFLGKSGGADSLSIWTHYFKDITYIENFVDKKIGYSGPAFKAGAGVQALEIYKAASEKGRTVVGGEGETVGIFGGYIQGGGHSPLTSLYGTGSDQVLSFEVVTANGKFVTANSTSYPDLFWALRGGGGSTFGVVTSVTVKAHPEMQTTAARFSFTSEKVGNETFWAGIRAYVDSFVTNADAGTYAYFMLIPNVSTGIFTFNMSPFFAPNKTLEETQTLLEPWFTRLNELGIEFNPNISHFDSVYEAWKSSFPLESVEKINATTGSRLFPRANFETERKRDELFQNIRQSSENNRVQVHFNIKAVDPANADNSVNPAWRQNILFSQQAVRWPVNGTAEETLKIRKEFQTGDMQRWRNISPGAGSYLAEADRLEPNFGQAFWGSNYPRLLKLKAKWDPYDVFFATTSVGSERWKVESVDGLPNENGKLCRVQ